MNRQPTNGDAKGVNDLAGDGAPAGEWQQNELPPKVRSGNAEGVAAMMIRFPFRPSNSVPHSFHATRRYAPASDHRLFSALASSLNSSKTQLTPPGALVAFHSL